MCVCVCVCVRVCGHASPRAVHKSKLNRGGNPVLSQYYNGEGCYATHHYSNLTADRDHYELYTGDTGNITLVVGGFNRGERPEHRLGTRQHNRSDQG